MLFKKLPTKVIKRGRPRKIKTEALDIEKNSAKSSPESKKCVVILKSVTTILIKPLVVKSNSVVKVRLIFRKIHDLKNCHRSRKKSSS